jgi:hypothetical protein
VLLKAKSSPGYFGLMMVGGLVGAADQLPNASCTTTKCPPLPCVMVDLEIPQKKKTPSIKKKKKKSRTKRIGSRNFTEI